MMTPEEEAQLENMPASVDYRAFKDTDWGESCLGGPVQSMEDLNARIYVAFMSGFGAARDREHKKDAKTTHAAATILALVSDANGAANSERFDAVIAPARMPLNDYLQKQAKAPPWPIK